MSKKRIVVVDDDKEFLDEFCQLLRQSNYQVEEYATSQTLIKDLKDIMPDLIILDLKLQGESGFRLASEIRKQERFSKIPILAMTGFYLEDNYHDRMKEFGINKYIIKDFNKYNLIAKIEEVIDGG
ncbi:MAG: response regulator [Candidatus Omnitrophota bacterium]